VHAGVGMTWMISLLPLISLYEITASDWALIDLAHHCGTCHKPHQLEIQLSIFLFISKKPRYQLQKKMQLYIPTSDTAKKNTKFQH